MTSLDAADAGQRNGHDRAAKHLVLIDFSLEEFLGGKRFSDDEKVKVAKVKSAAEVHISSVETQLYIPVVHFYMKIYAHFDLFYMS